jgi:hypothetical protein
MDEGATLGGLESEDDAEPGHGLHAVLSSLWGQGRPPHGLRIRFPEDEGVRRLKQPDQPRGLAGPARRSSGRCLTTFGAVSAVSATLPRPKGSTPRLPSGRLGASDTTRCPWAPQAFTPPWEGPFIIAKILKPGTYKLANDQGEVYSNAWNIEQLRRFYP